MNSKEFGLFRTCSSSFRISSGFLALFSFGSIEAAPVLVLNYYEFDAVRYSQRLHRLGVDGFNISKIVYFTENASMAASLLLFSCSIIIYAPLLSWMQSERRKRHEKIDKTKMAGEYERNNAKCRQIQKLWIRFNGIISIKAVNNTKR